MGARLAVMAPVGAMSDDRGERLAALFDAHEDRSTPVRATRSSSARIEDFVDRCLLSVARVALIWFRKGNRSNRALMAWFEPFWSETQKRLEQGERLIELRS